MKPLKKILKTAEPYDKDSVSKGDEDFIKKHKIEKTEDANGNDDDHFTAAHIKPSERKPRHGYTDDEDNGVYEERKLSKKQRKHLDKAPPYGKITRADFDALRNESAEQLDEVLKSSDPASEWIDHFVYSKNPKFEGKSKKERIQMALAARYAAKRGD